jgi:hypothetical protein
LQPGNLIQILPGTLEVASFPIEAAALVVGRQVIRIELNRGGRIYDRLSGEISGDPSGAPLIFGGSKGGRFS